MIFFYGLLWLGSGLEVVRNNHKPMSPAKTLRLEEDLRFGVDERGPEFLWTSLKTSLSVDDSGNIYVADVAETRLLMFDKQGKFLKTLCEKGEGPGEFRALGTFQVLADGTSVASEGFHFGAQRLFFYDSQMKLVNQIEKGEESPRLLMPIFSHDSSHLAAQYRGFDPEEGKQYNYQGLFDKDLNKLMTLGKTEQPLYWSQMDAKGMTQFLVALLENHFKPHGIMGFDSEGNLYTALSNVYEIKVWAMPYKKPFRVIKKDFKPNANNPAHILKLVNRQAVKFRSHKRNNALITERLLAKVADQAVIPPGRNPIHGFIPMENGGMLVITAIDPETGSQEADLFSAEGTFLGNVRTENWSMIGPTGIARMIFRNGYIYTLLTDEEEDTRVVRYRYEITTP